MQFGDSPTFRKNMSPPSSGSKSKPSRRRQQAEGYVMKLSLTPASAGFFFGVLFDSEYRGNMFLRNLEASSKYMALYPRRGVRGSVVG
jgi:hypothetical protein